MADMENTVGGGTGFPSLGFVTKPVKGSLVIWFNLLRDGTLDPLSVHSSCPVVIGRKHAAAKCMKYFGQWEEFKCSPDRKERFRFVVNGKTDYGGRL